MFTRALAKTMAAFLTVGITFSEWQPLQRTSSTVKPIFRARFASSPMSSNLLGEIARTVAAIDSTYPYQFPLLFIHTYTLYRVQHSSTDNRRTLRLLENAWIPYSQSLIERQTCKPQSLRVFPRLHGTTLSTALSRLKCTKCQVKDITQDPRLSWHGLRGLAVSGASEGGWTAVICSEGVFSAASECQLRAERDSGRRAHRPPAPHSAGVSQPPGFLSARKLPTPQTHPGKELLQMPRHLQIHIPAMEHNLARRLI